MYSRLLRVPLRKSFFLFGPRGTGKTTWVRSTFPGGLYLDLLESELFNNLLARPERLENLIPTGFSDWVIIDEIQRVPQLLNEVHRLIERDKLRFVLTGSNARKLRRGGENLLAGRALTFFMHPLSAVELGGDFDLNRALSFGSLPAIAFEEDKGKYLQSYVRTYLEEEVKQEGIARNMGAFARFLEAASFSQGSILNTSEVAREAAVGRKAVEGYFSVLEDLLIGFRLPIFSKRAKRRLVAHEKFYFFDTGVFRAIRPAGPLDFPEQIEGIAFETLFVQNLRAVVDSLNLQYKIYYYRTASGLEVDFVLYGQGGIMAFEIKRGNRISKTHFSGLRAFMRDYPLARIYLIYGGNRRMREGRIEVIPMEQTLKSLPEILSKH